MEVVILALILVALAIGGIAIKMFIKPGGSFTKTCTSGYDPDSGRATSCACASGAPEDCVNNEESEKEGA